MFDWVVHRAGTERGADWEAGGEGSVVRMVCEVWVGRLEGCWKTCWACEVQFEVLDLGILMLVLFIISAFSGKILLMQTSDESNSDPKNTGCNRKQMLFSSICCATTSYAVSREKCPFVQP